jgi:sugar/nucleoside kinase (ribokinase family)
MRSSAPATIPAPTPPVPRPAVVVGDVGIDVLAHIRGPLRRGTDNPAAVALHVGGAGGNTAAWLAAYGVEVALVARVGADPAGATARAQLTAEGVRCVFTVDSALPTCLVVVLVDESGERTMLPDRGANAAVAVSDLAWEQALEGVTVAGMPHLHLSGYVLFGEGSRAAGLAALRGARQRGWTTSVDPQAFSLVEAAGATTFLEWVRGVDLLLPNAAEARALGGPAAILGAVGAVAVTDGAEGARWCAPGILLHEPAPHVPVTDTTGAGDAFNAGLLASWLTDADPALALASGVRSGSAAVSGVGARPR